MMGKIFSRFDIVRTGGAALFVLFVFAVSYPRAGWTQGIGAETPYGGLVVAEEECTCSGATLVFIQDYATNQLIRLLYRPGSSKLFANYNPFGPYLLGTYRQGDQCRTAKKCVVVPTTGEFGSAPGTGTSYRGPVNSLAGVLPRARELAPILFTSVWR